jgi:hypothetical protein
MSSKQFNHHHHQHTHNITNPSNKPIHEQVRHSHVHTVECNEHHHYTEEPVINLSQRVEEQEVT